MFFFFFFFNLTSDVTVAAFVFLVGLLMIVSFVFNVFCFQVEKLCSFGCLIATFKTDY